MISPQTFSAFLLVVCVLAFVLGVFGTLVCTSDYPWLRLLIKGAFLTLTVLAGVAASLLVLLA